MKSLKKNGLTVLLFLVMIEISLTILAQGSKPYEYTRLGDPYRKSQLLAFERAPWIIIPTLIAIGLVILDLVLSIFTKERAGDKQNTVSLSRRSLFVLGVATLFGLGWIMRKLLSIYPLTWTVVMILFLGAVTLLLSFVVISNHE